MTYILKNQTQYNLIDRYTSCFWVERKKLGEKNGKHETNNIPNMLTNVECMILQVVNNQALLIITSPVQETIDVIWI